MKLIPPESLTPIPWKNGGGTTRELACHPPGASFEDFLWRISIADVNESGAFSIFPGIDRVIALLEGDGMDLEFEDGKNHPLTTAFAPFRFRGEDRLHARLAGKPSRDINLMLRRDAVEGTMEVKRSRSNLKCESGSVLLFCARGNWDVRTADGLHHDLGPQYALIGESTDAPLALAPQETGSVLLCMRMTPRKPA